MKCVKYSWIEHRVITVLDEINTDSYDEMISDIQDKICQGFMGYEDRNDDLNLLSLKVEGDYTSKHKINSIEKVPKETAIEKARRLKDKLIRELLKEDYNKTLDPLIKITKAYEMAYMDKYNEMEDMLEED